jgi:hypothetical protein
MLQEYRKKTPGDSCRKNEKKRQAFQKRLTFEVKTLPSFRGRPQTGFF